MASIQEEEGVDGFPSSVTTNDMAPSELWDRERRSATIPRAQEHWVSLGLRPSRRTSDNPLPATDSNTPVRELLPLLKGLHAREVSNGTVASDATVGELTNISKQEAPVKLRGSTISPQVAKKDLKILTRNEYRK